MVAVVNFVARNLFLYDFQHIFLFFEIFFSSFSNIFFYFLKIYIFLYFRVFFLS